MTSRSIGFIAAAQSLLLLVFVSVAARDSGGPSPIGREHESPSEKDGTPNPNGDRTEIGHDHDDALVTDSTPIIFVVFVQRTCSRGLWTCFRFVSEK